MKAAADETLAADEPDWGESLFETTHEFADNPEPRCPWVLVLDTSSSMAGAPLAELCRGVQRFHEQLLNDPVARQRVEVAVVTFGSSVEVVQPFVTSDSFRPPVLEPGGQTPLGSGLVRALDLVERRKAVYRAAGISYSRAWIVLITDGMPQGEPWEVTRQALRRMQADEAGQRAALLAVGIEGANRRFLARLSPRPPVELRRLRFDELFQWLSASAASHARSATAVPFELASGDLGFA